MTGKKFAENVGRITQHGKKKIGLKTAKSKKIADETFQDEWDRFYAENDVRSMDAREIAMQFYNMGIIESLGHEDKDFKALKDMRKNEEMIRLRAERMIKELKSTIFRIDDNGKLNIKSAINVLVKARRKHSEDEMFVSLINDEIDFLKKYKSKKVKKRGRVKT